MKLHPILKFPSYSVVVFLLISCGGGGPATPVGSASEHKRVRETLHTYVDGRQARDLQLVQSVLDPEVDQLTSRGEWRRGIDATTSGMKRSTATNPGDPSLTVETVRFLSHNVALADAQYVIEGTDGPDRVIWSSFTLVKGRNGVWRISSIRNLLPSE
tara:strand:- start:1757 stop:2230 length:474 start_codon:yes stop_codon:yes gene_type:complete